MKRKLPGTLAAGALLSLDGRFTGIRADAGRPEDRHGHRVGLDHRVARIFHEPRLRARRVRLLPGEKHRQHPLEELHRLRDLVPRLLRLRLGPDVRQRHRLHRPRRPVRARRRGQQPGDRRRLCRRLQVDCLDRRSAEREVLLPARLRRHGRDDRLGRGRRAHQVPLVHRLLVPAGRVRVSDHRPLDLGRRLPRVCRILGLRGIDRRAQRRRMGGAGRHPRCSARGSANTARTAR